MTRVFISYAASDPQWPTQKVQGFVTRMEEQSINVCWDVGQKRILGGRNMSLKEWVVWMSSGIESADHVLCLVSSRYKEVVDQEQGVENGYGVAFEASQIIAHVYKQKGDNQGWAVVAHDENIDPSLVVPRLLKWDLPSYALPREEEAMIRALVQPSNRRAFPQLVTPAVRWGEGTNPIPVVLAGCGWWARNRTVFPLLKKHPDLFRVVAITSLPPHTKDDGTEFKTKQQEFDTIAKELETMGAGKPKFYSQDSLHQVLNLLKQKGELPDGAPHCVLINTPNSNHSALASEAFGAGCHVYSERPAIAVHDKGSNTDTDSTLEDLVNHARTSKLVFYTGVQRRLEPTYQYLERYVRSEEFGRLTAIRCRLASGRKLGGWRANAEEIGCGILMDEGYHLLDAGMWLLSSAYPDADMAAIQIEVKNATLLQSPPYNLGLAVPTSAIGSVLVRVVGRGESSPVWLHFDLTYDASPRSVYECLELFSDSRGFMRLYRNQLDRHPPRPGVVQRVQVEAKNTNTQVQLWDSALDRLNESFIPIDPPENPPNYGPLRAFLKEVARVANGESATSPVSVCDASKILHTQRLIEEIVSKADRITHSGHTVAGP